MSGERNSWQVTEDMISSTFQLAVDTNGAGWRWRMGVYDVRPNPSHPGRWRREGPFLYRFLCFEGKVNILTLSSTPEPLCLQVYPFHNFSSVLPKDVATAHSPEAPLWVTGEVITLWYPQ